MVGLPRESRISRAPTASMDGTVLLVFGGEQQADAGQRERTGAVSSRSAGWPPVLGTTQQPRAGPDATGAGGAQVEAARSVVQRRHRRQDLGPDVPESPAEHEPAELHARRCVLAEQVEVPVLGLEEQLAGEVVPAVEQQRLAGDAVDQMRSV